MKVNPNDHQVKPGTIGSCICGTTWEVAIEMNGIPMKMEAHSSSQSLEAIAARPTYALTYGKWSRVVPCGVALLLEDGDKFYSVPSATY